jgi:hypothetical protein
MSGKECWTTVVRHFGQMATAAGTFIGRSADERLADRRRETGAKLRRT